MQSQQKKVKWSRGETADALEERTDTGITQVSASKMENIISDIYGNISRRPALKIIDSVSGATDIPVIAGTSTISNSSFVRPPQSFVFTIDENTYIIFISGQNINTFGGLLINNNKFVRRVTITNNTGYSLNHLWFDKISVAQNNNWMVVSNLYAYDVVFKLTGTNLTNYAITVEKSQFSAPWYAPNGTQTKQVSASEVTGLSFDSASIGQYTYTEANGETTVYSWISTGISQAAISGVWSGPTTTYYCHYTSSNVWIDTNPSGGTNTSSFTMTNGVTYVGGQQVGTQPVLSLPIMLIIREKTAYFYCLTPNTFDVSDNMTISQPDIAKYIPAGSIVQFPNNGAYMRVEGYDSDGTYLRMYGSFLTPVANNNTTDTIVKVEIGYVSLQDYIPLSFAFSNQRLYASNFYNGNATQKLIPGYVVGSQIGRYTDFKNDYNLQSEAVIIDINTKYQEKITALIDYNGLKILTDAAEYAYINGGVVKQSENGSLALCEPLVFGSVCLYPDKSGGQIRAIQYELQTDLFNSSSINEMTQEDLIFATYSMGGFIDKEHFTGHFLYAVQSGYKESGINWGNPIANHSMAVCNFVPANQVVNWSRWTTPDMIIGGYNRHTVSNVIEVNNKVWFIVNCQHVVSSLGPGYETVGYTLAELDYNNRLDLQTSVASTDTRCMFIKSGTEYAIIPGTISVFDGDEYKWDDTLNSNGNYTKSLTGLTNPRVGFMIDATLESHPIDIQGKTYTEKKRIGKCVAVIRDTEPGAFTVCDKSGYTSPDKKTVNFYGCTGMKDLLRYTIKNIQGAKFTIESLTMIIEHGTLDS